MTSGALPAGGADGAEKPDRPGQGRERERERTAGNDAPQCGGGAAPQWGFLFSLPPPRVPSTHVDAFRHVLAFYFLLLFADLSAKSSATILRPYATDCAGSRPGDWRLPAPRAQPGAAGSLGTHSPPGAQSGRAARGVQLSCSLHLPLTPALQGEG